MMEYFIGKPECFTSEHLESAREEKGLASLSNLEKALFALEYVGQLQESGLELVFKGGSAVQILLGDKWNRLSVDVDVCSEAGEEEIEKHLWSIKGKFDEKCFRYETRKEDETGNFQFYRVSTLPITGGARNFLLDIQGTCPIYTLQKTPLRSFFYDSDLEITTPTVSSILGDKLSVIGPSTIGRKLDDSRNGVEYAKHLYDIYSLSRSLVNFEQTKATYESCVDVQSLLREQEFGVDQCVEDAVYACQVASLPFDDGLASNMAPNGGQEALLHYRSLKRGLERFRPFIVGDGLYSWDEMREYASRTALLLRMVTLGSSTSDCISVLNKKPPGPERIAELVADLEGIPEADRWFMDFRDLELSPVVLGNWHAFYFNC